MTTLNTIPAEESIKCSSQKLKEQQWEITSDGDAFGLFDCTYTKQEELQFIGSELPSYIELSATNSQYTMTPQSCVGKMDCNPKNGEKVVGTSEWPPAEWTRV